MLLALLDEEHALDPDGHVWVRLVGRWELGEGTPGAMLAASADPCDDDCEDTAD